MTWRACVIALFVATVGSARADWRVLPPSDQHSTNLPSGIPADAHAIKPGDKWPADGKFRWLIGELTIPESIDGKSVVGQVVGMHVNCGDGGEVYVNGQLQTRYDNDHPALVLLSRKANPGQKVWVVVQVYGKVQGGDSFSEANWVLIEPQRVEGWVELKVNANKMLDNVPNGIIGLSQGAGLADYEDATAAKLKEGGFRWFRMDNIFTGVLKKNAEGQYVYDWTDFDRRVDFIIGKMGADVILAVSYMPQVLDAVPNRDRQSAPKDYGVWEELCFQAAKRCLDRGRRVAFWEVWNEVNAGWLKPGPQDTGSEAFKKLYTQALGHEQTEQDEQKKQEVNRRFEAYCKLYRATARGVLRADPKAKIGGPALASGPFEKEQYGPCVQGRGFARGLMLWCRQENLPLDFVSWHEYFQESSMFAKEADAFREYLSDFPEFQKSVGSFMITEWNEAWWPDRPQDHELGAAWCADCVVRAFIPKKIDRPCFFYVKQGDMNFRGDWSLLMQNNVPKAQFNMAKIFNHLSGRWIQVAGGDDDVCGVACWDERQRRLAIVLVNFRNRYALRRQVNVHVNELPRSLAGGRCREWIVDATHSNVWNDQTRPELTLTRTGRISGNTFDYNQTLMPNSITLLELFAP